MSDAASITPPSPERVHVHVHLHTRTKRSGCEALRSNQVTDGDLTLDELNARFRHDGGTGNGTSRLSTWPAGQGETALAGAARYVLFAVSQRSA